MNRKNAPVIVSIVGAIALIILVILLLTSVGCVGEQPLQAADPISAPAVGVEPEPEEPSNADITAPTEDTTTTAEPTIATTTEAPTETTKKTTAATEPESDDDEVFALANGASGDEVAKVQQRLEELNYMYEKPDGVFGGRTEKAVILFQTVAGLNATGIVDDETKELLFSANAPKAPETGDHEDVAEPNYANDYYVIVYTPSNSVLVLGKDDYNRFTREVTCFSCSTGRDADNNTPAGLYSIEKKYRWRQMFGGVYAQYACRFVGNYLFHSVPYYSQDPANLEMEEFSKLGTPASAGCVRLCVRDAKWIYDNLPIGTQVRVIESKEGPHNTKPIPALINDAEHYGWDPTDPNERNPYNN